MDYRAQKRIIIAVIYAALWAGLFILIWFIVKGPSPSCFDGVKNQRETGIDCGGPCKACISEVARKIDVLETGYVNTISGKVDVYAQIENANQNFGVANLAYKFEVLGANEEVIASKRGRTFILPQQKRYLIEQGIAVDKQAGSVRLILSEPQWTELDDYQTPNLAIKDKTLRESLSDEHGFMTLEGLIINSSNYDFAQVEVLAILKDRSDKVVAVGRAIHNTITARKERIFKIIWPYEDYNLKSAFAETYALTNIFDNDNFLKAHGITPRVEEKR